MWAPRLTTLSVTTQSRAMISMPKYLSVPSSAPTVLRRMADWLLLSLLSQWSITLSSISERGQPPQISIPRPSPPEPVTRLLRITSSAEWSPKMPPRPVLWITLPTTWLRAEPHAMRMPPPYSAPTPMFSMRQSVIRLSVTPPAIVGFRPEKRIACGPQVLELARLRTVR